MIIPVVSYKKLTVLALQDWAMIIALIIVTWHTPETYPLTCLLIAGRYNSLGIILHDLSHQNLTQKNAWFRICEVLVGYTVSSSANALAYHHNRHHRHTNTNKDPYYDNTPRETFFSQVKFVVIRGVLLGIGWWLRPVFAIPALLFKNLRNFYGRTFLRDVSKQDLTQSKELITCLKEDIPIFILNTIVFLSSFYQPMIFYFYIVPMLIAGVYSMMRLISEHNRKLHAEATKENVLLSTFDNHLGLIDRMLISPRNVGYHVAHHLYPTAPLYSLPKITELYIDPLKKMRTL